jgi:hypothetical protein
MFGERKLDMPKTEEDFFNIHRMFGLECSTIGNAGSFIRQNAKRLVELNNEVYERYHQKWVEGYNQRIQDEQEEKV